MNIEPAYLTKRESEIYSSLKKRELNRLIGQGRVRAFRVGPKKILIERRSLDQYIEEQEITPQNRQAERSELQQLVNSAISKARANLRKENKTIADEQRAY